MTTSVKVDAHAGWPVVVKTISPETGEVIWQQTVEPNTEQTFYVHSTADLLIREVQK